ncbi:MULTISPECIES: hypothetical protein [Sphingobacterium]|uniref:hypothetical protein n=1 Tax=Sphingobacterium TaxID=28453 RepID=UPI0010490013|nr:MULTISPECIES: hypothetical protein [Sphingobacterium]MCW2259228.1 ABC-type Fe3+-citrate transport system substrate-binding protein [Sphingobacterium kitahiroshimense]NJI72688.1 hypothetical protein [Sphingobacterium sp. B16(2022)]
MKKMKFILVALMGINLVSACGNSTNNKDQNNMDSLPSDTGLHPDTSMQDTSSTIEYRDSNSAESSNGVLPTTR